MGRSPQQERPKARLPKGFRDVEAEEIQGVKEMLRVLERVYETYGFEPLETPFLEYTDALGKFLPDQDRPNEGVFSIKDEDNQWLSLRYDLTAPLARYVAEHYEGLAKPFRSYRSGWVFRNEKPGPGRFRQFMQFDADTVGTASPAADAEVCMMAADALEALGIERGSYVVKFNSRKILDGVQEQLKIPLEVRTIWLRALDKLDRLGPQAVKELLGKGRKDESGDFTKGAGLTDEQISESVSFAEGRTLKGHQIGFVGTPEIDEMRLLFDAAGYGEDRIRFDPSVVRGLDYYTGAVFEAELTFETMDEAGQQVRFGSVGGGGRYDDLVARFRGEAVPATGFSMGVSRLYAALKHLGRTQTQKTLPPVVVLVLDRQHMGIYQKFTNELRAAKIRAEMYLGTAGMKAQMKYADRRGAPLVVIQGTDERERKVVQIKDLAAGADMARQIDSREEWRAARAAQIEVPESELVAAVKAALEQRR
ncbi:MAG TPA: histidine--tRNA ligase [Aestuariivirgaceae bacterium]|nr:histidine--tRNA ligase [Aestuariivirgaceae bacterium]